MGKRRNRKSDRVIQPSSYARSLLRQTEHPYWERLSQLFAILILSIFPLMCKEGYINLTENKFRAFIALTLVYLACATLLWLLCFRDKSLYQARKQKCPQKLSIAQIAVLLYVLWGGICALVSTEEDLWLGFRRNEGVLSMLLYAAVFLALSLWGEYSDYLLPALSVTAIVQAVLSLSQIWGGGTFLYPEGYSYRDVPFVGTLGNIDIASGFIALVLPALVCGFILLETRLRYLMLTAAALLFAVQLSIDVDSGKIGLAVSLMLSLPFLCSERTRTVRALYALATLFAAGALSRYAAPGAVLTASPKTLIFPMAAVVLAAAGFLLSKKDAAFSKNPRTIRLVVAALELAAVIGFIVYLFQYSGGNKLLWDAHELLHGRLDDKAGSGRGLIWKVTVQLMNDNPIFGCGPGGYARSLAPYYDHVAYGKWIDVAHNDFLHIGACSGYVGLFFYVVFVVSLAVRSLKNIERCPLLLIFASATAGYLAHSFFSFSVPDISPLFWATAGLLEKLLHQLPAENGS